MKGIPVVPEEYLEWLQRQRDSFAKWDSMLQNFLTIQPEDLQKLHLNETITPVFRDAFDDRLNEDVPPYYKTGFKDVMIEWTYTIDLDREFFSVDSGAHFRLNHIPRNDYWISAFLTDDRGNRFLLPQLVHTESIASLSSVPPNFANSMEYKMLQTRTVRAKSPDHVSPSCSIAPTVRWMFLDSS